MQHPKRRRGRSPRATATAAAVVLGAGTLAGGSPAYAAPPEPVVHYTMDEVDGDRIVDASGNGLDGRISGEVDVVEAQDGTVLRLGGGHVAIPSGQLQEADDLTVSTRVRWSGDGGAWQWLLALGADTERYLFTTPSHGEGQLRSAITAEGAGGESTITGLSPLHAEEWATLTVTLDSAADTLTTYLNGVAVGSTPTTINAAELWGSEAEVSGYIGRSFYPDPPFTGEVDDFRIYDAALTEDQVAELQDSDVSERESIETEVEIQASTGSAPQLPETVRAEYTDGYPRAVPVSWEEIDPADYAQAGEFSVTGDAAGTAVSARVTVKDHEVTVDLAGSSGAVHGGASGVLYGLYDEGMPTDNLIEGMNLQSVATKAQDGSQHPGSDALEVLPQLAETTDGDIYLRITDWYRGFPYQIPGETPEERRQDFLRVLDEQLEMIEEYADRGEEERRQVAENLVIEPFNEPEGNMFSDRPNAEWSVQAPGESWLTEPELFFQTWDEVTRTIRDWSERTGLEMRIAGPGAEHLWPQIEGYLEHTVAEGTLPDIVTWHELTHPQAIRDSVAQFRSWEQEIYAGTAYEGVELPININEYAFNYHTSVPGQMIQWISAIEDTKVDAMIAFWNINGNLADSAVQANRGNGQWWLYNAYAKLSGETVELTAPHPGENYTLQGVAALDEKKRTARTLIGGADGVAPVTFDNVPADTFGEEVRAWVQEIPWTGQLGDSAQPRQLAELVLPVQDGQVRVDFDGTTLPMLKESSAYEIVLAPAGAGREDTVDDGWEASYEAEDAQLTGEGFSINGPEGSPAAVDRFYTSGGYHVGGLRTGGQGSIDFTVEVPEDGTYDLSVFANSLNTVDLVQEQGPTNVFLTVDGEDEQEIFLPLGYKWVVWDHTETTVELTEGTHTISLSTHSLDGERTTAGDALVDRITLSHQQDGVDVYPAETAQHEGSFAEHDKPEDGTGSGGAKLAQGESVTFWVYGAVDGEAQLQLSTFGRAEGTLSLNDRELAQVDGDVEIAAHLEGGINKVTVTHTGDRKWLMVDSLTVAPSEGQLPVTELAASDGELAGEAALSELSLAADGTAVTGVGGEPGNENTVTFTVDAAQAGPHAVVVRYSNPEQVPATHYNPNPMGRHAAFSVNGEEPQRHMFAPTFHENSFFERTIMLDLEEGTNTVTISAEEQPNFDGETHAEDNWPGIPLRAGEAPIIDRLTVSPLHG
ncbi:LamG-like jellyroll fold domain-containing protein [Nesterenkonia sp. HG001]|uniref:LamG-like jellyroll fold domain-containing protein n=1 Tax=Nesterenkonia sp. HG001 TaxID=2983207 RepID=UPI002AC68380|nr:LamG-like jellyroll fold domain-containing protein [Nesterenkonia sp. HG001]MDZ5078692.1 Ig-like domain-containing protein [Nesterenkonia sp. HG001]